MSQEASVTFMSFQRPPRPGTSGGEGAKASSARIDNLDAASKEEVETAPPSAEASKQQQPLAHVAVEESEWAVLSQQQPSVVVPLATALGNLLCTLLISGYAAGDKELRNDVLSVINLLCDVQEFCEASAAVGTITALLAVGTYPELGSHSEVVGDFALSTEDADLELRQLAWATLAKACVALPDVLAQAVDAGLVRALLLYANPRDAPHPALRRWHADGLAALTSAALSRLHTLAPLCFQEYERAGGVGALVAFIAAASANSANGAAIATGTGAASSVLFTGTLGGSSAAAAAAAAGCGPQCQQEAALRHVHKLLASVPAAKDASGAAGLVPVLLEVLSTHAGSSAATGARQEGAAHFAALSLSALCSVHAENQRRLRKAGGVAVLLAQLARMRGLDPLLPSPLAVAVLDAVWTCVVPDRKSTAHFLVGQGLDQLLGILEAGNKAYRPVLLSLLADLMENPKARPFLHEWRSDVNKQTAAHLLLALWSEEDALRGMSQGGLLANTSQPLAGTKQRTRWVPQETVSLGNTSPAKKEVLTTLLESVPGDALLSKLYAVFRVCGFDSFAGYVDAQDRAVLAVVEKYVKFRQGEVWQAIKAEFEEECMRPTAPDRARLDSGIELSQSLAVAVREAQAAILGRHQGALKAAEAKFFEDMRAQQRLEHESRFAQRDKSNLTLSELREAKAKKEAMLRNSMASFVLQDKITEADLASTVGSSSVVVR